MCGLFSNIRLEISENKELGKEGVQAYFRLSGSGQGGETMSGKHLSTMSIYFKFDHFRLLLILAFGSEPRREAPSIILIELRTSAFP